MAKLSVLREPDSEHPSYLPRSETNPGFGIDNGRHRTTRSASRSRELFPFLGQTSAHTRDRAGSASADDGLASFSVINVTERQIVQCIAGIILRAHRLMSLARSCQSSRDHLLPSDRHLQDLFLPILARPTPSNLAEFRNCWSDPTEIEAERNGLNGHFHLENGQTVPPAMGTEKRRLRGPSKGVGVNLCVTDAAGYPAVLRAFCDRGLSVSRNGRLVGGDGGIRTLDTVSRMTL